MSEDGSGSTAIPWVRQLGSQLKQPLPERQDLLHGLWALLWLALLALVVWQGVRVFIDQQAWWPLGLALVFFVLYSLFLLLTYLLPRIPSAGEWLVDHGVTYLTAVMMMTLILALLAWWVVNFHWTAEEQLTSQESTSLGTDLTLSAAYPAVALIRPETDTLTLTFAPAPTTTRTITAVITPGDGLSFAGASGLEENEITIELAPHLPGRTRVAVVNDETIANLWRTAESDITVDFRDAGGRLGEVTVPVTVEGRRGFAMRRFVNSAIDRASPAIFLLLLVLPGLATLVQKAIDARTNALHASRKAQFEGMVEDARRQFLLAEVKDSSNIKAAAEKYGDLQDRKYKAFDNGQRAELGDLLALAGWDLKADRMSAKLQADRPPMHVLETSRHSPLIFAGAVRSAYDHFESMTATTGNERTESDPNAIRYWYTLLRGAQERSFELKLEDEPRLARQLAPLKLDRTLLPPVEPRQRMSIAVRSTYALTERQLKIPFTNSKVEDASEEHFLLDGGAFWGGHDLVKNELRVLETSYAVFGSPGSGRSALVALASMWSSPRTSSQLHLYVRLDRGVSEFDILSSVAESARDWLLRYPSFWLYCSQAQKRLVARLLLNADQDRDVLLAKIDQAQAELPVGLPGDTSSTPEAREARKRARQHNLEDIKQFVQMLPVDEGYGLSPRRRMPIRAMLAAAHALEFERVILVHETRRHELRNLERMFLKELRYWHTWGLRLCLFPQDDVPPEALSRWPGLTPRTLTWNQSEFEKMLKWRYERFLVLSKIHRDSRPPHKDIILACLGKDGYDRGVWESLLNHSRLDSSSYNPGQFMRLWRLAAGDKMHGEKITQDHVDAAVRQLGGQS